VVRSLLALAVVSSTWLAGAVAPSSVAAATCGPAPAGQLAVHVVVDRGSGTPAVSCVIMSPGREGTGLRALQAHHTVRLEGGFVCAIGGQPATGCATNPSAGTAYWSYWHATPGGSWEYSQVGAGGFRLSAACSIEGWVWSSSPATAAPPRVGPGALDCDPPRPAAPAPTPTPAPAAPSGGGDAGSGAAAGTPGSTASNGTPAPGSTPSTTTDPTGDDAARDATTGDGPEGPTAGSQGEGVGEDAASGDDDRGRAGSRGSAATSDGADEGAALAGEELAAGSGDAGAGGAPWGVLVGVVLVGAVGAAAVLRARRRGSPAADASTG
jgi:hypothetical protein